MWELISKATQGGGVNITPNDPHRNQLIPHH